MDRNETKLKYEQIHEPTNERVQGTECIAEQVCEQDQAAEPTNEEMQATEREAERVARPVQEREPGRTVMLQGTSSDVGKSLLATALCRIFVEDGWKVAPFKSQNMSLNSFVTPDGKEIGRAQGMQADACRIAATTDMNPILLKPTQDMVSQVVVHGKPYKDLDARTYRESYLSEAEGIVRESLARLRRDYELVVIEGAGSPAEVNLKDRDIVNMRLAGWADAPVLLVADIDRGGVFASIVGTLEILTPEERDRVKGFIINKFRGDVTLLKPGLDWLEQKTGKPVLGVIPFLPGLELEDEDSASLESKRKQQRPKEARALDIAVIRLPRIANFTDIDPLYEEEDVRIRFVTSADDMGWPDAVILPGSQNTMEDLAYLRSCGLDQAIARYIGEGGRVAGLCGGYQMLGKKLIDSESDESNRSESSGLGLLPTETLFVPDNKTERIAGYADGWEEGRAIPIKGYEIHMGLTRFLSPGEHPFRVRNEREGERQDDFHPEGAMTSDGRIWGSNLHGVLHNDEFRRAWLNRIRQDKGWPAREGTLLFGRRREAAFEKLAFHVREHLAIREIYEMIDATKTGTERIN
ncbi:cobyric acid synthase [Paenibacillus sp. J2TS4]|uniref:cobyric acid synthase n=1 Tax=Paenibacillus sp. J2TS4 TaxID=2807194 RepID=UPI001B0A6743|nr:cobyric acid synthase [Paenibacillus sp. J2TS4]GIP34362.1 cobyric acid synthase [Paenibacillus sp. J2TS4]